MTTTLLKRLDEVATALHTRAGAKAKVDVVMVLGSGLGAFADSLEDAVAIPYQEIPHFPNSTVAGHAGRLVFGKVGGRSCVVMQGRVHYYEGHSAADVVFPLQSLVRLGAKTVLLTNAAGGLTKPAGSLMLISDHLNLIPDNPLRGTNEDELGPRFPDMTEAYSKALRAAAQDVAREHSVELLEGVYAAVQGPSYETPAEIEMYRRLGADAVGMSTAPEAIAANHMGAKVLGISCITNAAAGMTGEPLSHEEVTEMGREVRPRFEKLLSQLVPRLPKSE